jgi:flagellar biosynthesis/type III secretory pathway protein FliH
MLATRVEQWKQKLLLEGEQRGEQRGLRQGEQQGLRQGEQKGLQQGKADLLLRQLERRFGVLPAWARDRVLAADTVMIEEWGLRVLDATSLEEVFA